MISDPTKGQRDGPSKDNDPGDGHSGEGLASVRPALARRLADSARRSLDKQMDASSRAPNQIPDADAADPAP